MNNPWNWTTSCTCGDPYHNHFWPGPATVKCPCGSPRDPDAEMCPDCKRQQEAARLQATRREAGLRARRSNQHPKARLKGWRR